MVSRDNRTHKLQNKIVISNICIACHLFGFNFAKKGKIVISFSRPFSGKHLPVHVGVISQIEKFVYMGVLSYFRNRICNKGS